MSLMAEPPQAFFTPGVRGDSHHKLFNGSGGPLAVKIKCSDNSLYKVRPVYAVVGAGSESNLVVARAAGPAKTDKLVIQSLPCQDGTVPADVAELFKAMGVVPACLTMVLVAADAPDPTPQATSSGEKKAETPAKKDEKKNEVPAKKEEDKKAEAPAQKAEQTKDDAPAKKEEEKKDEAKKDEAKKDKDPAKKEEQKKEEVPAKKEDAPANKEEKKDEASAKKEEEKKEVPTKKEEAPAQKEEEKKEEIPVKKEEEKKEDVPAKKEEAPAKKEEDKKDEASAKKDEAPAKKEEEKKEEVQVKKEDTPDNKEEKKDEASAKKEEEKKDDASAKKEEIPAKKEEEKKEEVQVKKEDTPPNKEEEKKDEASAKKEEAPAKKEEEKKEVPVKKEEEKKEDVPAKKAEEKKEEAPAKKEEEKKDEGSSSAKAEEKKPEEKKPEASSEGLGREVVKQGGQFGEDLWVEVELGAPLPTHTVLPLNRPLKCGPDGAEVEVSVALMYYNGKPVMGRAWKDANTGAVALSFPVNGREHKKVETYDVLRYHNPLSHGFEYRWLPYAELKANSEGWEKVHVGSIAPCVCLAKDGREFLGKMDLKMEAASYGEGGKEHLFQGSDVAPFLILSRRNLKK